MSGMTYEARKRSVFDWLYREPSGFLQRYRVPEHMSDDAARDEVNDLVEDINRGVPADFGEVEFQMLLPELMGAMRRRHGSQSWPPAKVFIAAAEDAVASVKAKQKSFAPTTARALDEYEINGRRMERGEPVGDGYLWGRQAVEIIARGLIDRETMERCRSGAFMAQRRAYGEDNARAWENAAKARHESARVSYIARQRGEAQMDEVALRRLEEELAGVGVEMDRRAAEMRRSF